MQHTWNVATELKRFLQVDTEKSQALMDGRISLRKRGALVPQSQTTLHPHRFRVSFIPHRSSPEVDIVGPLQHQWCRSTCERKECRMGQPIWSNVCVNRSCCQLNFILTLAWKYKNQRNRQLSGCWFVKYGGKGVLEGWRVRLYCFCNSGQHSGSHIVRK